MDDRAEAIDILTRMSTNHFYGHREQEAFKLGAEALKQKVDRRGNWEHYEHREPQYDIMGVKTWAEEYKCSNCGFIHTVIEDFGHYSFCPRCGADMRDKENETCTGSRTE